MNFREMNLRVFQRKPIPHVFYQPRIEPWLAWHKTFGRLPKRYEGMEIRDLFDDIGASMRYVHYYTGMPDPVVYRLHPEVKSHSKFQGEEGVQVFETPLGEIVERYKLTTDKTWRKTEFGVKTCDDLKKLRWLFEHSHYEFSKENFQKGEAFIGERGAPQFWVPKSPYQALAQIWMKLDDLIYALVDCPSVVEDAMKAIDDSYDPLYEQLCAERITPIINFGENIHDHLFSPAYFEKHLIPFFEKRSNQLRRAGIFTHVHIDGYFRSLLPYLKHMPFDGYEALTPTPQGDVPLEEIKEYIGDKILLDGIPAIFFVPPYTRDDLMACAEKLVELFHPRLVLGISDEVPEGGGEEAMERVRMVAEWARGQTFSEQ